MPEMNMIFQCWRVMVASSICNSRSAVGSAGGMLGGLGALVAVQTQQIGLSAGCTSIKTSPVRAGRHVP